MSKITAANRRLLLICSMGGVLEFYDFVVYALMAGYLAQLFFPSQNHLLSLMATFATFSLGYLVRPLGGIVFGHFGDRVGRKQSFTYSVLIMAISTLAIGLVPTYKTWGVAAPIVLTLLRICQGFSLGGEIPGALSYASESVPDRKGVACAIIFSSLIAGLVLGSLVNAIITAWLPQQALSRWGWRLPFLLGGIFGFVSYILRCHLTESVIFQSIAHRAHRFPLATVLKQHKVATLIGIILVGYGAVSTALYFIFTPAYVATILHQPMATFLWVKTAATASGIIYCIGFGFIADRFGYKWVLLLLTALSVVATYGIFAIYAYDFGQYAWALILSGFFNGCVWGMLPSLLVKLFPVEVRYSGSALSYNIGFGFMGGLTPLIATGLIHQTNSLLSPAYYFAFSALLAIIALWIYREGH
ncbi:MAG: MFS transporter [Coxiellaceae bacterium]|nr:MFS transporter [Coxiellaceae bacterium]